MKAMLAETTRSASEVFARLYEGRLGSPHLLHDPDPAPDGRSVVVSGVSYDRLGGVTQSKLYRVDMLSGAYTPLSKAVDSARMGRHSPEGTKIAFLSDAGPNPGLCWVNAFAPETTHLAPTIDGLIESFSWSADGERVLLLVAERGVDIAAALGGKSHAKTNAEHADWTPETFSSETAFARRRAAVWRLGDAHVTYVGPRELNVWEAAWCGAGAIAAVVSEASEERAWFSARLVRIELDGTVRNLHLSPRQIGGLASSPSGARTAFVEAVASDRGNVCGVLKVIDGDCVREIDGAGVDICHVAWRNEDHLVFCGVRGLSCVAGEIDFTSGARDIHYDEIHRHSGFYYPQAQPFPGGGVVHVTQGFASPCRLEIAHMGANTIISSIDGEGATFLASLLREASPVWWAGRDGMDLQGWLLTPRRGAAPFPMVMEIHGGPVWVWRPMHLTQMPLLAVLLSEGFAVFLPNPRGSTGRGQDFAALVQGDMAGEDTHDYLTGLDALQQAGIADPNRLYATGSSYGGYMSAWLAQDCSLAAVAPRCPVTNWHTQHWTSNIGDFDVLFLASAAENEDGPHFERSPVNYVYRMQAPCLLIAGAQDKCTPPSQAEELFGALRQAGRTASLAIYPKEGHGFAMYEARCDVASRMVAWFNAFRRGSNQPAPTDGGRSSARN